MIGDGGQALPADHPDRFRLNNETHARPSESLPERTRISYLVLFGDLDMAPVYALCEKFGCASPTEETNHFSVDLGPFRMKWERHTEFTRYWFFVPADDQDMPFSKTALSSVPQEWLETLSGEVLVANHVEVMPKPPRKIVENRLSFEYFAGNMLVGVEVSGGLGFAFTDFRIHADGFGRVLVYEKGMAPRQRGRTVQRLLEIETYRTLALLALPMSRNLTPILGSFETELTEITVQMRGANESAEPALLDRLTMLHADIVQQHTSTQFRFAAARAYSQLVAVRIDELREQRIEGLQTYAEFNERRLAPAMRTCEATAGRLNTIAERVAHATQLLSTRVAISREKQNQALLESMDRRAKLQLRLQQTVEGLSIAAITYYIVGLVGYLAKGAKTAGVLSWDDSLATAISIPFVLMIVAWGIRHARKSMTGE